MQSRNKSTFLLPGIFLVSCGVLILSAYSVFSPTSSSSVSLDPSILQIIPQTITLQTATKDFSTPSASLISPATLQAFASKPPFSEQARHFFFPALPRPSSPLDPRLVTQWIESLQPSVEIASKSPQVVWGGKNQFSIDPGKRGERIDTQQTQQALLSLQLNATTSARIVFTPNGKELTPDGLIESERLVRKLIGKSLVIRNGYYKRTLSTKEIVSLLDLPTDFSESAYQLLVLSLHPDIETDPVEPKLIFSGDQVTTFTAPRDGVTIDGPAFATSLSTALRTLLDVPSVPAIEIPLHKQAPKNSVATLNTLGIQEKIGQGESAYAHSIPNRIHNVSHTTARIHAKLIKPGEEFSFNKYLGEVSAATGFKQAYVIKEGQTVLGDGGGVCQVSSTLFRALLNAGLPITERKGHSYRVGYYEQNSKPGFDATVYDPHPDLRFVNDTGTTILINAVADPKTTSMYVELWGKSDGRKAEVVHYRQWDAQPAPPPRYQDDPTLRPGQLKQIDYAAPGIKTAFDYIVTYPNGEVKQKTFSTNYIPWAAVYLRGI